MNYDHLYIHIPFCENKCEYCAFYSETSSTKELRQRFLTKLETDLSAHSVELQNLKTIFIGGGTPSALTVKEFEHLFSALSKYINLKELSEFTIENNPESLTKEKIQLYKKYYVNRVSIGVQSFNPQFRKTIGRKASPQNIEKTSNLLKESEIDNINLDLIYGIPGQKLQDWLADLNKAVTLPISHISAYSLTIEEGTLLAKNETIVNDDEAVEMQLKGIAFLESHGFKRYEISNYCKNNQKCLHNDGIWHGETYLGLGPNAASFDGEKRFQQPQLANWLDGNPPGFDIIPRIDRVKEIFMIGLRTCAGWQIDQFEKATKTKLKQIYPTEIEELIKDNFLKETSNHIFPTEKGLLYADYVATELL